MQLFITLKQLGRKKDVIGREPLEVESPPSTAAALIAGIVSLQVRKHNSRPHEASLLPYLTTEEIDRQAATGKVSFGVDYNGKPANEAQAIRQAFQAFEDGIFRFFINDSEIENLDTPLSLQEGDRLIFIRLTMLAGRMW